MKKLLALVLTLMLCLSASAVTFTDTNGREVTLDTCPESVVALLGSYGEVWLAAGGRLAATTQDALESEGALAQGGIENIGSHSEPNMELLYSLNPGLVILSSDTAAHVDINTVLEEAGIPTVFLSILSYEEYLDTLKIFTELTGREDLMAEAEANVREPIDAMIAEAQAMDDFGTHTCLLLRAYATSVRAKDSSSTVAGVVLSDMGFVNIADGDSALSENLTLEAIIAADPEYIFMVPMGSDTNAAIASMEETFTSNPAWGTLSAVTEGRYIMLDKALFHQRPNGRWAESYATILDLLK